MGTEQFIPLKEKFGLSMVDELASTNEQTDNYLNKGGFLKHFNLNILNYNKHIKDTFDPKFLLTFGEEEFAFGTFIKNNESKTCICIARDAIEKAIKEQLLTICIDSFGLFNYKSVNLDRSDIDNLFELIIYEIKSNNLYADNFDILEYLKKTILMGVSFTQ